MAIEDNTLYGLTGAQVKELPEKIEAVKGLAKVLTADDYNWPTNNPTRVAVWTLEPGLYIAPQANLAVTQSTNLGYGYLIFVNKESSGSVSSVVLQGSTAELRSYRTNSTGAETVNLKILSTRDVQDNLVSVYSGYPLSAAQGKVLNDKIGGDLSNLTTADKTSLIAAINEVAGQSGGSYTAGDGIDITNDVISATNTGKTKELSAADYNYDYGGTGTNNRLALWLLDSGVYSIAPGTYVLYSNQQGGQVSVASSTTAIVSKTGTLSYASILYLDENRNMYSIYTYVGNGAINKKDKFIKESDVKNVLTSTDSTAALSAAQGKVLKDLIDAIDEPTEFSTAEWNSLWT